MHIVSTHLGAVPLERRRGERRYRGDQKLEDCVVLCAQPDDRLRRALFEALHGVRVVPALTGLEALGAIDAAHFNLYILDSWLPDWSGLGLCRHIRKRDRLAPICFYTHADVEGFRTSAVACGADLFLRPTLKPEELRMQLEEALKVRLARLAARAAVDHRSGAASSV